MSTLSKAAKQSPTGSFSVPVKSISSGTKPLSAVPLLIQPKMKIGESHDRYEQEADRVTVQAMRGVEKGHPRIPISPLGSNPSSTEAPPIVHEVLRSNSRPLDNGTRTFMEQRFGYNFSRVRLHDDSRANESAMALNARAYTVNNHIVFGKGQNAADTTSGRKLMAHELVHVVQQTGESQRSNNESSQTIVGSRVSNIVQGSFFGDLWEGITSVASSIGQAISGAAEWVGERFGDVGMWAANLFRDLPARLARFGQAILDGLSGVVTFLPEAIEALASGGIRGFANWLWERARSAAAWGIRLVTRIFDLVGGPEAVELIMHLISHARPLTSAERAAAQSVLGPSAIRWDDVRVGEGGLLSMIFALNNQRAFTTFHTINLPAGTDLAVVVHELTHVYQYERTGSFYICQAIYGQMTTNYNYGGPEGLSADRAAGKHFRDYDREQQGQIAQDYYVALIANNTAVLPAYEPFIAELRAGAL